MNSKASICWTCVMSAIVAFSMFASIFVPVLVFSFAKIKSYATYADSQLPIFDK